MKQSEALYLVSVVLFTAGFYIMYTVNWKLAIGAGLIALGEAVNNIRTR